MFGDDNTRRYRALLEISEGFLACRDYETLFQTLWSSLHELIRFDYLALIRYKAATQSVRVEALIGNGEFDVPLRTDLPIAGTPMEILVETRQPLYIPELKSETRFRPDIMATFERFGIQAGFWVPLSRPEYQLGALSFASHSPDAYSADEREFMEHVARHVTIAVENALAFEKISELRRRIEDEKVYLEEEIRTEYRFDELVGNSPALRQVLKQIETAAPTDSTVLIQGETGTGKELVARAIHHWSSRKHGTFVKLNCSAIPAGLIESELLGHEKGAFTGAIGQRIGRLSSPTAAPYFWMRSAICPRNFSPSCSECCRMGNSSAWAGPAPWNPTLGWWPRPTAICAR